MAELKTKKTESSVPKFIATIADETRREDAKALVEFMRKVTKAEPKMWGPAIIGFGSVKLKYDSGRELDWFPVGFSPRKAATVVYGAINYEGVEDDLAKLGKHKAGKGCLYINELANVDMKVLKKMLEKALKKK